MERIRIRRNIISFGLFLLVLLTGICSADDVPLENQCQPYIEKAINDLKKENVDSTSLEEETTLDSGQNNDTPSESSHETIEITLKDDNDIENSIENKSETDGDETITENVIEDENKSSEQSKEDYAEVSLDKQSTEEQPIDESTEESSSENKNASEGTDDDTINEENGDRFKRDISDKDGDKNENELDGNENSDDVNNDSDEEKSVDETGENESQPTIDETQEILEEETAESKLEKNSLELDHSNDEVENSSNQNEILVEESHQEESVEANSENTSSENEKKDAESPITKEETQETVEEESTEAKPDSISSENETVDEEPQNSNEETHETLGEDDSTEQKIENSSENDDTNEDKVSAENEESKDKNSVEQENSLENLDKKEENNTNEDDQNNDLEQEENNNDDHPEEDLLLEFNIPSNLRDRTHIAEILHLDDRSSNTETAVNKAADIILRDLKRIYDNAIKPLETVYKYRDLSNRHFGDPEIFSKPLVLFMGPWSGGKSTILNYLSENEYTPHSIRSGAEPSPAYFNILMHGDTPEVLDGTQLAADWTFSGLQKFGQGMLDRLRGVKLPNKLLEKVNIVEIPGILEVRKQVSRLFPFNDACQWFIDRADIIFLVYDPSKLDVGPETEAILDQLKGREYQTRILLNKADTVKPEELLRVQSALIWNISPLMSSAHPPVIYTVSLWSHPYREGAPTRLLQAQERALLKDLQEAVEKRIENKIASARRFAVRIRNHAKMVDCYLTTYYNHKTLFANKKQISDHIIENPSHYHIYEGLSTLTNISRYDLPNEDAYRDFFKLNPLYNFKRLAETCTYFRGCPINQLDVAISYQLPELAGKYKKILEQELGKIDDEHKG